MMKNKMLKNAAILGFSGVCAKGFDFAFRAFYSRSLGKEGMGLLSLGFGIHSVMLTVATAGLGVAVSKIVSEYLEENDRSAVFQCMKIAVWTVSVIGLLMILLTFIGAEWIAGRILGDPRIASGLCCLIPSVLFMGISYCLKGYFYAERRVICPASSEFFEQLVKYVFISVLLKRWLPKGIAYGCTAVFMGITVGEFFSCLYLSFFFIKDVITVRVRQKRKGIFFAMIRISFPSMLSALTGSVLRMQEEVWIIAALKKYGYGQSEAVGQFGLLYGMAMPLLIFPLTLIGSVTTLLVPEIARACAAKSARLHRLTQRIYAAGLLGGLGVMVIFFCFPHQISGWVYHQEEIGDTVRCLSALCPVMFLDTLSCAVLNGMGKQFSMLCCSLADSLLRLAGIYFLIPRYGMRAMLWVIVCSNLFTCSVNFRKVFLRLYGREGACRFRAEKTRKSWG